MRTSPAAREEVHEPTWEENVFLGLGVLVAQAVGVRCLFCVEIVHEPLERSGHVLDVEVEQVDARLVGRVD